MLHETSNGDDEYANGDDDEKGGGGDRGSGLEKGMVVSQSVDQIMESAMDRLENGRKVMCTYYLLRNLVFCLPKVDVVC